MLIDTHCHLFNENLDVNEVIKNAKEANVLCLILAGASKEDNIGNLKICDQYENLYTTLGFHPSEASTITEKDIKNLENNLSCRKVIGVGEIGLDYHYGKEDKELQISMFEKQLKLAEEKKLPVVIHTRDSIEDTYQILKKYKVKGVIHCFSGSLEMACKFIDLGFFLGIGGVVTFKNSKLASVIKELDLKNIVLETDSPYLSPFRGEKNEPKNIREIALFIAKIKGVELNQVAKITSFNARSIFDLSPKI